MGVMRKVVSLLQPAPLQDTTHTGTETTGDVSEDLTHSMSRVLLLSLFPKTVVVALASGQHLEIKSQIRKEENCTSQWLESMPQLFV